ncbi:MAG: calcium-binding protein [Pseudomonadota bacterium]
MSNTNTMNLYIVMHHGSPREMFDLYMSDMDTLFGGEDFNPYRTDAVGNTLPVLSRPEFAQAIKSLSDGSTGKAFFDLIKLGTNVHQTFHKGYNSFFDTALGGILGPDGDDLSIQNKKALIHSLDAFAKNVALEGFPPIDGTSASAWQTAYNSFLTDKFSMAPGALPSQALIDAAQQYEADFNLIPIEDRFLDDPTSKSNAEARAKFIADSLDKAATFGFDNGLITQNAAEMYRLEAETIRLGAIKGGDASQKFYSMMIDIGRQVGIIDSNGDAARNFQDPGPNLAPFDPGNNQVGLDRLEEARKARDIALANKNLADDIKQTAEAEFAKDGGVSPSNPTTSITASSKLNFDNAMSKATSVIKNFAGDESGSLPAQNFDRVATDVADSFNRVMNALEGAAIANNASAVQDALTRATGFINDLDGHISNALGNLPSAKVAGFLGVIGDAFELTSAIATAYDQLSQGDFSGALATMANAVGSISAGTIAGYIGMAGAVLLGGVGFPVLAAGIVTAYFGSKAWDDHISGNVQGWFEKLSGVLDVFKNPPISPLVLDLDGDGVELTSLAAATVYFDVDIDGFKELTGWVSPDDGLLAMDVDGDGKIDDGSELFGDQTGYAHGFLALAALDENFDGVLDASDSEYAKLQVWQDLNSDGYSQADELSFLTEIGITSISVNATAVNYQVAGNDVLWDASFTWADGTTGTVVDAYFQTDPIRTQAVSPDDFEYHPDVFDLPFIQGAGHLANIWVAMSLDDALRAEASGLVALASSGNIADFRSAFDSFVMNWAGVSGITGNRGDMNGQHLAFLEVVFDQTYEQGGGSDPLVFAAQDLGTKVHQLLDVMAAEFLSQVAVSNALQNATTQTEFEQLLAANPFNGFSTDAAAAEDTLAALISNYEQGAVTIENAIVTFALWKEANGLTKEEADQTFMNVLGDNAGNLTLGNQLRDNVWTIISDGKIYMWGGSGDDVITTTGLGADVSGHRGDDVIFGAYGGDTYNYRLGDGSDYISDFGWSSDPSRADKFRFFDAEEDEVVFSHNPGGDLVITAADGAQIVIEDHFANDDYQIEEIEFYKGGAALFPTTVLNLQGTRDKSVSDQKSTGFVRGSWLVENYYHTEGEGSYTIYDFAGGNYTDKFTFVDLLESEVSFNHNSDADLIITTAGGDVITVTDHFQGTHTDLEQIVFADDGTLNLQGIRDKSVADQKASGFVRGSQLTENYYHTEGEGSYTIYDNAGGDYIDRFTFSNLLKDQVAFGQNSLDDLTMTTAGGDVVTITDHFLSDHLDIEQVVFADGETLGLYDIRQKSVSDQKSTGLVRGTKYTEEYVHWQWDGTYTILDYDPSSYGSDKMTFADLNIDQVSFAHARSDNYSLVMTTNSGDVIKWSEHFSMYGKHSVEQIDFADGTTLNKQQIRDKSVQDMKLTTAYAIGTDLVENYVHTTGDGTYAIFDRDNYYQAATDTFAFADLNSDEVWFSNTGGDDNHLVMKTIHGETITWQYHFFDHDKNAVERIDFADGVSLSAIQIALKALTGSSTDDYMVGFDASETMTGGSGNDYIFSSGGNDVLFGDAGDDELRGGVGDDVHHGGEGNDDIYAWDGNDVLNGDGGDDYLDGGAGDDDSYGGAGNDYILGTAGDDYFDGGSGFDTLDFTYTSAGVTFDLIAGTITFANGFIEYFTGFEKILSGSGDTVITGDAEDNEFIGGDGDDVLTGGAGNDVLNGGLGDDNHYGGDGNDLLIANIGADYFDGGAGVDTLDFTYSNSDATFNLANGTLAFTNGFSETFANIENIVAGNGINTIIGSTADNHIDAGGGSDTMSGGGGADVFVFAIADGIDTITDFEDGFDKIAFTSSALQFGDLAISANGTDTVIAYGSGDQITLSNVSSTLLTVDDFEFNWV